MVEEYSEIQKKKKKRVCDSGRVIQGVNGRIIAFGLRFKY